ncbi:MAG: enoyl-CoA hydratase/isomerase family protein [Deltaproteobacteria bacterium]|nr:enoyl-CoA hydratase/isomerase family protein [Deltaproteobacteria bacterium]
MSELTYRRDERTGIATFELDTPGPVNTIGAGLIGELYAAVVRANREGAKGVLLVSAKPRSFLDGANLVEIRKNASAFELEHLVHKLHDAFAALARSPFPVAAALEDQTALGGGCELLLWACDHVFAGEGSKLGLPEVDVGLFPAAGGMEALRRLAGLQMMLDVVLNGRVLPAAELVATGVVTVVPTKEARERARKWLLEHPGVVNRNHDPARRPVDEAARGEWPAMIAKARARCCACPEKPWLRAALDAVEEGLDLPFEEAVRIETRHFAPLIEHPNSQCKIDLFLTVTGVAPRLADPGPAKPRAVDSLAVLGAGLMGRGIAQVCADAGLRVLLLDVDAPTARAGRDRIAADLEPLVKRGKWSAERRERLMGSIEASADRERLAGVPLVIESVFEDLALKRKVLGEVRAANPEIVFASNTSTLPMDELAQGSARPELVVGMHYFSPVPLMPLCEVIRGPRTSPEALATAVAVGRKQKKTVIVVGDGPGFYTSRTFGVYVLTGFFLAEAGLDPWEVDRLAVEAGFPQGPLDVYGTAGGNVIHHAATAMKERMGDRLDLPESLGRLWKAGYVGAGKPCFYKERKEPDRSVLEHLVRRQGAPTPDREEAKEMLLLAMTNEAFRCVDEGILADWYTMDVGAVMGIGFPDCWHGPARYASLRGLRVVRDRLNALHERHGLACFRPAREFDRLLACGVDRGLV